MALYPVVTRVEGLAELENNLRILREQFGVKTGGVIIRGLRAGAKLIVAEAKRKVPSNIPSGFAPSGRRVIDLKIKASVRGKKIQANKLRSLQGLLRANIVEHAIPTSSRLANGRPTVLVRVRNHGYTRLNGKIRFSRPGTDPGWWWWVEFGTSRFPARPFMRPAAESQKEAALKAMQVTIRAEIDKLFKKHVRRAA